MPSSRGSPERQTKNDNRNKQHEHGKRRDNPLGSNLNQRGEQVETERICITTKETLTSKTESSRNQERVQERRGSAVQQGPTHARSYSLVTRSKATTTPKLPWNPKATLISHTTAPLAPRISIPPLESESPLSLQPTHIHELSLEFQEAAIIEDLLYVLMGYEGQYIRFAQSYDPSIEKDRLFGPSYKILTGLDASLLALATPMLKLGTYYKGIEAFVGAHSRAEYGAVSRALCASMRGILHDYLGLTAQLEMRFLTTELFTLNVFHLYTLPTGHIMEQMFSLCQKIVQSLTLGDDASDGPDDIEDVLEALREGTPTSSVCKGGNLLRLITKRLEAKSGDPPTKSLLTLLLKDASRPYMVMLNEWLHRGRIQDPSSEFMIRELKSIGREDLEHDYTDNYWDRRYRIQESVPPQLESVKEKILLAGKYLNVVYECGGVDKRSIKHVHLLEGPSLLPSSFDDPRLLENVNAAYKHANEALLKFLLTTYDLPTRLRSLKHYFFLDRSDFLTYFLELSASELRKPADKVNESKLQSLLDVVLNQTGSLSSQDPYKDDITAEINPTSLLNSLTRVVNISGLDQASPFPETSTESEKGATGHTSLQLNITLPFPVSLVISRKTIWRYQVLFRHLLSLHHLEAQLTSSWQASNRSVWARKDTNPEVENLKRRVLTLRARMISFVQHVLYFCTSEVIEPNWQEFMRKLPVEGETSGIKTVDGLMSEHVDFLDTCLKGCMLTNGDLLKLQAKLLYTCTLFTTWTTWFSQELFQISQISPSTSSNPTPSTSPQARIDKMQNILAKCETNFGKNLRILLKALNVYAAAETSVLFSLCGKLGAVYGGEFEGGEGG